MQLDTFDGLPEFMAVARHKSFRGAAKALGVTPAAVSQAIRRLENRLGLPMFHRTTRKVSLTEAGTTLLTRLEPAVHEISSTLAQLDELSLQPTGILRLSVHSMAMSLLMESALLDFRNSYPKVNVEIDVQDAAIDIVEKQFDAGIRIGEFINPDMVAIRLSQPFRWVVLGAPSYFAEHGRPVAPKDLIAHQCIRFRSPTSGAIARWDFSMKGRSISMEPRGGVTVNNRALMCGLAAKGMGLIYTSEKAAAMELANGELEAVLQEYLPPRDSLYLYYPRRNQMQPKLRAFIDLISHSKNS